MSQPTRRAAAASRSRRARRGGAPGRSAPRPSQRERLIDAIVELAGRDGYQNLTVAQISGRAGVSSATFYEQFADREECLLAAYRVLSEEMLERMASSLRAEDWASASRPAFSELLRGLEQDPDAGRLMFVEALAGGPRVRAEMSRVLDGVEGTAEALLDGAPPGGVTLDIPGRALVGAVRNVVCRHLRSHSEDRLPRISEEMLAWMGRYAVPVGAGRWSTGPAAVLSRADRAPHEGIARPERLPRGRHGLSPGAVARNQRGRILLATASVTMEKGYAGATVADIVASAGVAKEAFYKHFRDKEHVFLEAQQAPNQQILDALVGAYFSVDRWPERIWLMLRTLLNLAAANPAVTHLRLVDAYTAGAEAARRAEGMTRAFTIFLEEGYRQRPDAEQLPRIFSQAIAGGIFEIIQHEVAGGRTAELPCRLPQLAYVAIAPFLGPDAAIAAVTELGREG